MVHYYLCAGISNVALYLFVCSMGSKIPARIYSTNDSLHQVQDMRAA